MTETVGKGKFLLEITPREKEILDNISELKGFQIDTKKELFHRGLHSARQLVDVDEKSLMKLLVEKLEAGPKENAEYIKALSNVIYATLIAKQGIRGAEVFQSIPLTCSYLDLIGTGKIDEKQLYEYLESLPNTIKTFFLNDTNRTIIKNKDTKKKLVSATR